MTNRRPNIGERETVLNRDGWCCNRCGYTPYHTFADVPFWAKTSYRALCGFANDLFMRPPVIFVNWEKIIDNDVGDIHYNFNWLHGGELEFDHIVPIGAGGSYSLENVQALCHDCHRIKTSMESRYTESVKYTIHKYMSNLRITP